MPGRRRHVEDSIDSPNSYPHEVAKRIWEDMRMAKRRPRGTPDGMSMSVGVERTATAAQAASQFRNSISRIAWDVRTASPDSEERKEFEREARRGQRGPEIEAGHDESDTSDSRLSEAHSRRRSGIDGRSRERVAKPRGRERHRAERDASAADRRTRERTSRHMARHSSMPAPARRERSDDDSMHIMWADITPAPRDAPVRSSSPVALRLSSSLGLSEHNPKWSNPNAIEARMLGVAAVPGEAARKKMRGDEMRIRLGYGDQTGALSDTTTGESDIEGSTSLPEDISELLRVIGRGGAEEQEVACEVLRSIIHQGGPVAGLMSREQKALETLARGLIGESERARVSTASCFRYLALEAPACACILRSTTVLPALVYALKNGSPSAQHKAAAALGNLAWRDDTTRARMLSTYGLIASLLSLLWDAGEKGKASSLAALANLSLNEKCAAEVASNIGTLDLLAHELQDGSDKAQVRAAGILRNIAATKAGSDAIARNEATLRALKAMAERALDAEGEDDSKPLRREASLRAVAALSFVSNPAQNERSSFQDESLWPQARQQRDHHHRHFDDHDDAYSRLAASSQGPHREVPNYLEASPHPKGQALQVQEPEPRHGPQQGQDLGRFERQRDEHRETSPPPISASALSLNALASFHRPPSGASAMNYAMPSAPPSRTGSSKALVLPQVVVDGAHSGHVTQQSDDKEEGNDRPQSPANKPPQDPVVKAADRSDEPFVKIDLIEPSFQPSQGLLEADPQPESKRAAEISVKDILASFSGVTRTATNTSEWNEHTKDAASQPSSTDKPHQEGEAVKSSASQPSSGGMPPRVPTVSVEVGSPVAGERYLGQTPKSSGRGPKAQPPAQAEAPKPKLRLDEEAAVQLCEDWLSKNGWTDIENGLFEAVETDMSRYKMIEEDMEDLDPQEGIYSYQGHILRLTGQDRFHPLELIDDITGDVWWDARREQKVLHPWAKKHFMLSPDGERKIVLKRTGHVAVDGNSSPAGESIEQELAQESSVAAASNGAVTASVHSNHHAHVHFAPKSKSGNSGHGLRQEESKDINSVSQGVLGGGSLGSNPTLWRQFMSEALVNPEKGGEMTFKGRILSLPKQDKDGDSVIRDLETGEVVYKGPGQHEVFPPKGSIGQSRVRSQFMSWVSSHGWHDLQGRLFDAGTTDYSVYASIDREMQPIPGMHNLYNYQGRTLQLEGDSRRVPRRLLDCNSQQMLWDKDSNTQWHHPWARQSLMLTRNDDMIVLLDKETGSTIVSLELASNRSSPGVDMSDEESGRRLMEWTRAHGWHDLQRRLFDFVDTDFTEYAKYEERMIAVPGTTNFFEWEGRRLRLDGNRQNPVKLCDVNNGAVLWDRESNSTVKYPWAKAALIWRATKEGFVILSNNTGSKIVEVFGGKKGSDSLLYQSIIMDGVPMAKIRGLESVKGIESLVQVTKEYQPDSRAQGFITIKEGDVILLTSPGENGWAYGRLVLEKAGKTFFDNKDATVGWGSSGWYPQTFAMPLLEMSKWKKRVLHVRTDSTGHTSGQVIVTDALTGETLYSGSGALPLVEWHVDTSLPSSQRPPQPLHDQSPLQSAPPTQHQPLVPPSQRPKTSTPLGPSVRFSTPEEEHTSQQAALPPFVNMSSFDDVSEREIPPISPVSPSLSFASVSMPSSSPSPNKHVILPNSETKGSIDKGGAVGDVRDMGASFEQGRGTPVAVSPVAAGGIVKSSPFKQLAPQGPEKISSLVKSSPFAQAAATSHSPEKAAVSSLIKSSPFIQQDSPPPGRSTSAHGRTSSVRFGAGAPQSSKPRPQNIIEQRKAELSSSLSGAGRASPPIKARQSMSVRGLKNNLGVSQSGGSFGQSGWKFNRDLFDSIGGQGGGPEIDAEFICQDGAAKEETLKLNRAGAFVHTTHKGTGREAWVLLRGSYRLTEASRGGGLSDLLLRVESKAAGPSRSAAQEGGEVNVEGVYVRGRAARVGGGEDLAHIEWVSETAHLSRCEGCRKIRCSNGLLERRAALRASGDSAFGCPSNCASFAGHEEVGVGACKAKLSRC